MSLARAVRALRERKGWTQGQLSIKSKVGQSHVSKIERGETRKLSAEVLSKLALALDVSVDYLCSEAGLLPPRETPPDPMSAEDKLVETVRSVPTERIRTVLLEQLTWIAEVARDADRARQK